MIRLHQTFGAHTGRVVEIDRDVIRFGRLPDNEVAFDPHADLDASGRHAEIRRENGQYVVVDVGSRNGTLIAGRRVSRHALVSGEEIEFGLGGPRVRVEIPTHGSAPGAGARPGIPTAAATPVASGAGLPPSMLAEPTRPPPAAPHPTPPPSPFGGQVLSPIPAMAPVMHAPHVGQPVVHAHAAPHAQPPALHAGSQPGSHAAPAGDRRYGQRTVGMMIQAALQQADQQRGPGAGRSTGFLRAIAVEAAQRSSRGTKVAIGLLSLVLVLTLGAVVALFYYARWQEQDLRRELRGENVRLQRELSALGDDESAERRRLEQRIQALNEQLSQEQPAHGARIAEENDQTVYLVTTERAGQREVLCSAFSVRPDVLATHARCVGAIERAMGRDQNVTVLANRGQSQARRVRQMWRHPAFVDVPAPSPDVGLFRVDRALPRQVRLATMAELAQLRAGDDLFVLGFPEQIAGTGAPVAVLTNGVIGRMTAFDGTETDQARRHLISHSAFTDDGTAGSPVFDRRGRVVAINAGNFRARTRVVDPSTRIARTLDTETPYAWAVRVDLLLQLLAGLPQ